RGRGCLGSRQHGRGRRLVPVAGVCALRFHRLLVVDEVVCRAVFANTPKQCLADACPGAVAPQGPQGFKSQREVWTFWRTPPGGLPVPREGGGFATPFLNGPPPGGVGRCRCNISRPFDGRLAGTLSGEPAEVDSRPVGEGAPDVSKGVSADQGIIQ